MGEKVGGVMSGGDCSEHVQDDAHQIDGQFLLYDQAERRDALLTSMAYTSARFQ